MNTLSITIHLKYSKLVPSSRSLVSGSLLETHFTTKINDLSQSHREGHYIFIL